MVKLWLDSETMSMMRKYISDIAKWLAETILGLFFCGGRRVPVMIALKLPFLSPLLTWLL